MILSNLAHNYNLCGWDETQLQDLTQNVSFTEKGS